MDTKKINDAALDDQMLLEALIPGRGESINAIRSQIISFARNTSARGVLLIGPVGSGKSTIARIMALMRYLFFCSPGVRKQFINNLKFDGPFRVDKKLLSFYEEMNLTGLVPNLAQAQLFGVARRAATGVAEKPGIFEQAMTGHGKSTIASEITGGVVFLDEIGDLALELQPLLLSVLTGSEVYRVGGEGNPTYGYSFNGTVIAATWKNPLDGILRQDLFSRLSSYVIQLPGLNQRKDELKEIIDEIVKDITARHEAHMADVEMVGGNEISREVIKAQRNLTLPIDKHAIHILTQQDWDKLGDLRGMRQLLERCFYDQIPVIRALEQTYLFSPSRSDPMDGLVRAMIGEILNNDGPNSLTEEVRNIQRQTREKLAILLQGDKSLLKILADKFNTNESVIKRQLSDLTRDRSRKKST